MNAKMEILSSRRQTNIELCRIISIMLVLLVHSDFAVFGWPSSWEEPNVPLLALESFAIIGVNVFVFISGYFSVKVKKSSLTKLLFICLFCAFVKIVFDALFEERIALMNFFFVSKSNWFIPAYLGLILLSPFLNAFCEKTTKRELGRILFALIIFEAYFGFFPAFDGYAVKVISHGLSVFHFVVLYLIARYIRLFGIPHFLKKYCFVFYICCSLLLTSLAFILIKTNHQSVMIGKDNLVNQLFDYSNPLVIFSSVCFFLTFVKLSNNKIVARLGGANYVAQSVLTVLLLHTSNEAIQYLYPQYRYIYENYNGIALILLWMVSITTIFAGCALIDQLRIYSYKGLNFLFKNGKHE